MAESIREKLIVAVMARFEAMRIAEGFTVDLVLPVERDNYDMGENPPRPSVWLFEGDEDKDSRNPDIVGAVKCMLRVLVTFVADAGNVAIPTMKTRMLADLSKAMGTMIDVEDANGVTQTVEVSEGATTTSDGATNTGLVFVQTYFELWYHHGVGDQTVLWCE